MIAPGRMAEPRRTSLNVREEPSEALIPIRAYLLERSSNYRWLNSKQGREASSLTGIGWRRGKNGYSIYANHNDYHAYDDN